VLLQGEAGTGKSRLGRELLRRHREVTGLFAQGYPLAASAAFGLWTEAVDPFLQSLPDGEVVELCLICLTLMWLELALGCAWDARSTPCWPPTTPGTRCAPTGRATR
jgi:hypothetical protein